MHDDNLAFMHVSNIMRLYVRYDAERHQWRITLR
jgi:hypothetical protein